MRRSFRLVFSCLTVIITALFIWWRQKNIHNFTLESTTLIHDRFMAASTTLSANISNPTKCRRFTAVTGILCVVMLTQLATQMSDCDCNSLKQQSFHSPGVKCASAPSAAHVSFRLLFCIFSHLLQIFPVSKRSRVPFIFVNKRRKTHRTIYLQK